MKKLKSFINKYFSYILFFGFLLLIVSRFLYLKNPDWKVFDEIYYADFALKHLQSGGTYFDVHPPLGKMIISLGIKIFGNNTLGWRIMEAIFGCATVGLIYLTTKKIFKNIYVALIAFYLGIFSTMIMVESRLSLINIFLAFFILLTVYLVFSWVNSKKNFYVYLSLVAFALALLVKWTAFYIIPPILIYILIEPDTRKLFISFISKWYNPLILIILPVLIYVEIFNFGNISQFNFIEWHQQAYGFHKNLTATHPYSSKPWTWLFMIRPICLEYKDIGNGKLVGILEIENLAIMWTGIFAIIYFLITIKEQLKNKYKLIFLISIIFFYIIPWLFISRISFLYLFLPAIPFLIMIDAYFIYQILKSKIYYLGIIILILTGLWFIHFYPIVAGIPIKAEQYQQRMWLKSWI